MSTISKVTPGYQRTSNSKRMYNNATYIGVVKNNSDPQKMGRLAVWVPELSSDPTLKAGWITVSYAGPYAGATNIADISTSSTTMSGSQQSYGMWVPTPDIGNEVLITFVDGDVGKGFWFACIYQQNMNHMVPGVACNNTTDSTLKSDGLVMPTVEYNKINASTADNPSRPVFTPLSDGIQTQGLASDPERGPGSTSARRESPSKVFGITTPRGNSFHIDDLDTNELIRMRTRSGTQILIHETNGYIYVVSKNGNSWLEVSDLGVDIYSQNSVSIRAEEDFNIRADRNIIFDAGENIYMTAGAKVSMLAGTTMNLGATNQLILSSNNNGLLICSGSNLKLKANGVLDATSTGNQNYNAGGNIIRTAYAFTDNGSPSAEIVDDSYATGPDPKSLPNVVDGSTKTLDTIVSRLVTHEPFAGHPKSNLPSQSSSASLSDISSRSGTGSSETSHGTDATKTMQTGEGTTSISMSDGTKCSVGVNGKSASDNVYNAIKTAASQKSVSFGGMMAIAEVSSSFDPNGNAGSDSSNKGLYGINQSEWNTLVTRYGKTDNVSTDSSEIFEPSSNAMMGAEIYNENTTLLQSAGISDPSCGQVYMLNMLGGTDGVKFVQAYQNNPNAKLSTVLSPTEISNNSTWFSSDMTVKDAYEKVNNTMNTKASNYASKATTSGPCSSVTDSSGNPVSVSSNMQEIIDKTKGKLIGTGQCVSLLQTESGLPNTAKWKAGTQLTKTNLDSISSGTPIATFQNGRYTNSTNGNSHAAYYLGPAYNSNGDITGITVYDQWSTQPAHTRTVNFNNSNLPCNNAYAFSVINT